MIDISALHSAQLRNTLIRRAANRAVDKAMRQLHDANPALSHERMKTDPSNCRWCGEAQRDALAELEEDDG